MEVTCRREVCQRPAQPPEGCAERRSAVDRASVNSQPASASIPPGGGSAAGLGETEEARRGRVAFYRRYINPTSKRNLPQKIPAPLRSGSASWQADHQAAACQEVRMLDFRFTECFRQDYSSRRIFLYARKSVPVEIFRARKIDVFFDFSHFLSLFTLFRPVGGRVITFYHFS